MPTNSYKVDIRAVGETSWHSNGVRLPDAEQAEFYGRDLFCRATHFEAYKVVPSEDAPNYTSDKWGRLTAIIRPFEVHEVMAALNASPDVPAEMQGQIYKRWQALKHVVSECKYINETVTDDEEFAVQMMQVITMAESILDNTSNLPENWKE